MSKITSIGNMLTRILTAIFIAIFGLYGFLMLWDMYRTELEAFASYDLLQYRPNIEEDEPPYLDDLIEINPDTKAWITIYNTNIDYPVMQGKDDMEYLNKDVYGKYSLTGSIYLSYKYAADFSDPYSLIYGHHMANGSMFGDITKFLDKGFFEKNKTGVLIMTDKVYNLEIFALIETNAYDPDIFTEYNERVLEKAKYRRNTMPKKVVALSTCDNRGTDARLVLLCNATIRTEPLPMREEGESIQRESVGHPMAGAYWALMNLFILVVMFYISIAGVLKGYVNGVWRKIVIPIILIIAVVLFVLTEDMHKPIQIIDIWTLIMLILLCVIWGLFESKKE